MSSVAVVAGQFQRGLIGDDLHGTALLAISRRLFPGYAHLPPDLLTKRLDDRRHSRLGLLEVLLRSGGLGNKLLRLAVRYLLEAVESRPGAFQRRSARLAASGSRRRVVSRFPLRCVGDCVHRQTCQIESRISFD